MWQPPINSNVVKGGDPVSREVLERGIGTVREVRL